MKISKMSVLGNEIQSSLWPLVGIFFFISGYGLFYGYQYRVGYMENYWKRFVKVLIPFGMAHGIYVIGNLIFGITFTLQDFTLSCIGEGTLVRNNWYCIASLIFYILFGVIYSRRNISLFRKNIILLFGSIVYIWFFSVILHKGAFWWMNILPFWLGVIWSQLKEKEWLRIHYWGICFICLAGYGIFSVVILSGCHKIFGFYPYQLSYNMSSMCWAALVILLFGRYGKENIITKYLGKYSYEVYLLHGLFIDVLRSEKIYICNDVVFALMVIGCTIILSVVLYLADQKIVRFIVTEK